MKKIIFFTAVFVLFFNEVFSQNPYIFFETQTSGYLIEGNTATYRLRISGAIATPISVTITTETNTASSSDFTAINTVVTIPAGQILSSQFSIPTTNDALPEDDENFKLKASVTTGNTSNLTNQLNVYITDDDTIPNFYVSTGGVGRKYEGTGNLGVSVSLTRPYNSAISFTCVTSNITTDTGDLTPVNTTLTIPAGQTLASTSIPITDDALVEADETFEIIVTTTSGNTNNTAVTTTMILSDNDTTPTLLIQDDTVTEGQNETVYVRLNRPYNSNVVVNVATAPGTASTADYTTTTNTITFDPGSTSKSFVVATTNDAIDEPVEKFSINGTITSGNTTNTNATSEVSIQDNDGLPDLEIFVDDGGYGVLEGDTYGYVFVGFSSPLATDTVLQVATVNGTAGAADFVPLTTTVTVPAGQTGAFVSVDTLLDTLQEPTENFSIVVTNSSATTFNSTATLLVDIRDNYNIYAKYDNVESVFGVGTNFNLLTNDLLRGLPLNPSDAVITLNANTIGATVNAQGEITIPATVPVGYYQLTYTVCEVANPTFCSTATILVKVKSPLTASATAAYFDLNGDGYTNVGDVVKISYTITNIGNAPITNIVFDTVEGVTNFTGGPIASLAAGATDTTSFEAFYVLTQEDISAGYVYNYFFTTFNGIYNGVLVEATAYEQGSIDQGQFISLNISSGLKLNAFIDSDSNSAQNGLEVSFPFGNYDYSINGGIVRNVYTNTFHYLYESDPSNVYNLTYNVDTPYYPYNSCATSYSNVTVPTGSGITTKDFPIIAIPYQDLSVYLTGSSSPRPGEPYRSLIVYRNYSNQLVPSGTLTFNKPTNASIVSTSQSGVVINATGFTYNFTNLLPYETRTITIEMLTPTIPTVNLGDLLVSSASINEPSGDIVPLNNNSNLVQVIVGAYDPNDKMESHGGKILFSSFTPNDYLTYTIRFENTGTANANFVKITDVLDDKLEPSSIKMVHASADYILERVGASLTWKFNGINLPPSVEDTTIGKGYVTFQVKPKPGYAVGDIIPNFANIYFDTNPAIVTNTFNTEFVATLGSSDFALTDLKYYPNPVKNSLNISNNFTIEKIEVNSILGQTVLVKEVNDLQTTIDFSSLTNGVYFITVTSQGENKVIKIIKE